MIPRFFRLAYRHFKSGRLTASISIIGMATGITGFILLTLFINYFTGYDKFNNNLDSIYRIEQSTGSGYIYETPSFLSATLASRVAGIEKSARLSPSFGRMSANGESFFAEYGFMADGDFLDIFTYPLLVGDKENCLSDPNSMVISESLAIKMFGSSDITGMPVTMEDKKVYMVTGILKDPPENSILQFSYLTGIVDKKAGEYNTVESSWQSGEVQTWVLLGAETSASDVDEIINSLVTSFTGFPEGRELFLKPLKDIALRSSGDNKKIVIIYSVGIIALLILLVGTINFMQLLVNLFINRIRENSIRKSLGGTRLSLSGQFLGEGFLLSFISLLIAIILASLVLPFFNALFYVNLKIDILGNPEYYIVITLFVLATGILAAIYPVLVVLRMGSDYMLKRRSDQGLRKDRFRNFLVTTQLTFSVFLVVCTIALYQQVKFIQGMDKGFMANDIMVATASSDSDPSLIHSGLSLLKEELEKVPGVISASLSTGAPFVNTGFEEVNFEGSVNEEKIGIATISGDRDFIETYGIEIISGYDLSADDLPVNACLVNEAACRLFGWDNPLGKSLKDNSLIVRGVVKDFNFGDLNWLVRPVIITSMPDTVLNNYIFSVRLVPENNSAIRREELVSSVGSLTESIIEGKNLQYHFADDLIPYDVVTALSDGFLLFSVLAFLIAAIGLFGLIAFNIERERRAIGIRKAFGCSSREIYIRVFRMYLKLFIISSLVGSLLAYIMLGKVMTIFAYREGVGPFPYLFTIIMLAAVIALSVSWSATRVAGINPAESVRYD